MLRFVIIFILIVHGLIHLPGFVKEFGLAQVKAVSGKPLIPLSGSSAKVVGLLWLLACLLLIIAAIVFLMKKEGWWIIGAIGVLLSQVLIILFWQDAKFGTFANVILLVTLILSYGTWNFNRMVKGELKAFFLRDNPPKEIVTEKMFAGMPAIIQKWMRDSRIIGKERIQTVHLFQKGEMRTSPDGKWMPVEAEQYFSVDYPGFLWIADVKAAPFIHLAGRDKYQNGKGHMLIKLLSLFAVADSKGKEIDQGTMLRYLAEIVWFPSAALNDYIHWEEIDATSAKATMTYGNVTASGIYRFNNKGEVISFEAKRYYDRKEGATLEDWLISIEPHKYLEFEGVKIPAKSAVTWRLKSGDFTWYRLEITEIQYNKIYKK